MIYSLVAGSYVAQNLGHVAKNFSCIAQNKKSSCPIFFVICKNTCLFKVFVVLLEINTTLVIKFLKFGKCL